VGSSLFNQHLRRSRACILVTIILASYVLAQHTDAIPASVVIPSGTPIDLRLVENISSAHAHTGDKVDFVVVKDVRLAGLTLIQAGTTARGHVTEVRGRRLLGIGGRVSLKLDSVELMNGQWVGLQATKEVKGSSRTKLMVAGMIATSLVFLPAAPVLLLIPGHTSTAVKSTEITARIADDTTVLSAGLPRSQAGSSELEELMDYLPPRVFTGEGREGDMLNLAFVAKQEDLQRAFFRGGWVKTDRRKLALVWHLLRHQANDKTLSMARYYLFGRVQDYSYALPDPNAIMSRRHHLRIWRTEYKVDGIPIWVGAATHDVAIEIAKRGHWIDHRIDPAVDNERDFVGANLAGSLSGKTPGYLHCLAPVFEAQTTSGQAYHSDGRILFLNLHSIQAPQTGLTVAVGAPAAFGQGISPSGENSHSQSPSQ